MEIVVDDLSKPEVIELLQEHVRAMKSVHQPTSYVAEAFNVSDLKQDGVTFWTIWDGPSLAGCGAIKDHGDNTAELKSMRTSTNHQRKGVASKLLQHIVSEARNLGFTHLYLETGAGDYFAAARQLYAASGFCVCAAFHHYTEDPRSVFMVLPLQE
jgi:putative acetyltransferase